MTVMSVNSALLTQRKLILISCVTASTELSLSSSDERSYVARASANIPLSDDWPFKSYWLCDAPTSLTFNNCTLCSHRIYVFCIYLRTNSDLCHLQYKLIGFYSQDEKCLQRGTNWVFKYSSLRFVFKRLTKYVYKHALEKKRTIKIKL